MVAVGCQAAGSLLVVGGNVGAEVLLAQIFQLTGGTQLVNGGVNSLTQSGGLVALAQRDSNLVGVLGQDCDLDVGVGMLFGVVVEGNLSVQGSIDAAAVPVC